MAIPNSARRLTEAEYLAAERAAPYKSQFHDGEVFAMSGGTPAHSLIAANLIGELRSKLKLRPCRPYTSDLRIKVEATGLFTYPDVSVVSGQIQFAPGTDDTVINPILLVEVLSDSTEAYDRGEKFRQYRQIPTLKEYLLVSQRQPRIEQYLRRSDAEWTLRTVETMEASISLTSLDIALDLREVFAQIEFDPGPA